MSDYDTWLANSAPGVNDKEWDDDRDIECEECGFDGEAPGFCVGDYWIATFYWTCPKCHHEGETEIEFDEEDD